LYTNYQTHVIERTELVKKTPLNLLTKRIDDVDLGRKSPQSIEMEKAILAAIMIDKDAIDTVREILNENSFYLPAHQKIFVAALKISSRNEPIDLGLIAEQLQRDGVLEMCGGPTYLIELSNTVASSANVEFHSRIVAQKFISRELIKMGNEMIKNGYDSTKDVFETLDETESKIYQLAENYTSEDPVNTSQVLGGALGELQERMDRSLNNELQGVETGFKKLNELSGGWQKGDLIIVAGRPGMGKTAFTLALARNAAVMANKTAVFFSLEMPTNQLMMRLISSESDIEQEKIRKGTINQAELAQITSKMDKLNKVNLFFDDTPALSVMDFRKKVRKIKRDHGLDLIVIDYLQLMTVNMVEGSNKVINNREQQIAFISRSLKSIAKELEVPIIALAQLSRQAENRGSSTKPSKPMLSDLRESGSIEQDADMVIFLFREAYYDKDAVDKDGNSVEDIATISIAKNRNGRTESFDAQFIGKYVKYCDIDENNLPSNFVKFSDVTNKQSDDFGGTPTMTVQSKINRPDNVEDFYKDDAPAADIDPDIFD
jgi:replicative DNA helicase